MPLVFTFSSVVCFLLMAEVPAKSFLPQSFRADFIQLAQKRTKKNDPHRNRGTLTYQFPKRIHLELKGGTQSIYVSNPQKTWYYIAPFIPGENGECTVQKTNDSSLSRFFDILEHGLKSNEHYKVKFSDGKFILTFAPNVAKKIKLKVAKLLFLDSKSPQIEGLKVLQLNKYDGTKVGFRFQKITKNPQLKKDTFNFKIPPNTNVKSES